MGKKADSALIDGGLDAIANCNRLSICSAEPGEVDGIAAVTLASVSLDSGDLSKSDGDTGGRKLTVAQQANLPVSENGTASHIVIDDGSNIFVTTCASQAVAIGQTVSVPAFDIEIGDPT